MSDWIDTPPAAHRPGFLGWVLFGGRALVLVALMLVGLVCHVVARLLEWPFVRPSRPLSQSVALFTSRLALAVIGIGYEMKGRPMQEKGAVVANHSSWLDIFALNAGQRVYFVSKAEVAAWPGIGLLARVTGTVFIQRKSSEARRQQNVFEERIRNGHQLLFFPEGTSTDAVRVLPFKSTLFQAFFTHGLDRVMHIQPVTVIWHAPKGADPRFYGWWGGMSFAAHFVKVLSSVRQGRVEVICHPPVPVDAFEGRKVLAAYCENVIRTSHTQAAPAELELRSA